MRLDYKSPGFERSFGIRRVAALVSLASSLALVMATLSVASAHAAAHGLVRVIDCGEIQFEAPTAEAQANRCLGVARVPATLRVLEGILERDTRMLGGASLSRIEGCPGECFEVAADFVFRDGVWLTYNGTLKRDSGALVADLRFTTGDGDYSNEPFQRVCREINAEPLKDTTRLDTWLVDWIRGRI